MSHVAEVLKPHGIGLGLSINSVCESESLAIDSDPTCAPAYRDMPYATTVVLSHLYINAVFYQDRLGTNTGKTF
eukprot:COSAG06_NODE_91_length_24730_cov_26.482603_13_plen_74_part_00